MYWKSLLTPLLLFWALATLTSGCHTPKIDWNSRVGVYTFAQVVADMGPPDRQTQLPDGTRVAEWVTQRLATSTVMAPAGGPGWYGTWSSGVAVVDSYGTQVCVRLSFDAEGKLIAWKRVVK
jgi:hypothetical protein